VDDRPYGPTATRPSGRRSLARDETYRDDHHQAPQQAAAATAAAAALAAPAVMEQAEVVAVTTVGH